MDALELRKLQLIQSEILRDFKNICKKYNLTYFLVFGTLLGSVRHKGFIPWDDDIDVAMPTKDYLKFIEVSQSEFRNKYFLQTYNTDVEFHYSFAKIRKNNTTMLEPTFKNCHIHHGIWIDIFPVISINNHYEYKFKKFIINLCNYLTMDNFYASNKSEYDKILGSVGKHYLKVLYKTPKNWRLLVKNILINLFIFHAPNKTKKYCATLQAHLDKPCNSEWYNNYELLEFEGELFSVPSEYSNILKDIYGDYMKLPPIDQRKHHVSFVDFSHNYKHE